MFLRVGYKKVRGFCRAQKYNYAEMLSFSAAYARPEGVRIRTFTMMEVVNCRNSGVKATGKTAWAGKYCSASTDPALIFRSPVFRHMVARVEKSSPMSFAVQYPARNPNRHSRNTAAITNISVRSMLRRKEAQEVALAVMTVNRASLANSSGRASVSRLPGRRWPGTRS